jgi:hypothetical protein
MLKEGYEKVIISGQFPSKELTFVFLRPNQGYSRSLCTEAGWSFPRAQNSLRISERRQMTFCPTTSRSKRYVLRPWFDPTYTHDKSCQFLQITYTLDFLNKDDFYHSDVIRSKLIRNMPTIFKDVYDELVPALDDAIPTVGDGV